MEPTYYVINRSRDTGKETIVQTFHDIDLARKFIQGSNYYIAYDETAMNLNGYQAKSGAVALKLDNNMEQSWQTEYSMRRGEGASELSARHYANAVIAKRYNR
jgi:hypothetical protein